MLRMDDRLVKTVLTQMQKPYPAGSLLMDAPRHNSMKQLIEMAEDKDSWSVHVNAVKISRE